MCSGPVLGYSRTSASGMYQQNWETHNREIHSWTSLYFALHAQTTETVLPVAHSANSVSKHPSLVTSKFMVKMHVFRAPLTSGSHSFKAWALVAFISVSSSLLDSAFITPRLRDVSGIRSNRGLFAQDRVDKQLRHLIRFRPPSTRSLSWLRVLPPPHP